MDKIDDLHLGDIVAEAREDELERKSQAIKIYVKNLLTSAEDFEKSIGRMQTSMAEALAIIGKIEEGDWSSVPDWVFATIQNYDNRCDLGLTSGLTSSGQHIHSHR